MGKLRLVVGILTVIAGFIPATTAFLPSTPVGKVIAHNPRSLDSIRRPSITDPFQEKKVGRGRIFDGMIMHRFICLGLQRPGAPWRIRAICDIGHGGNCGQTRR